MEQIQELLEILKQTPQMALWALSLYFLFILIKLASWIFALKVILQQFIQRLFDYKDMSLNNKRGFEIAEMFEKQKIGSTDSSLLIELLNSVKIDSDYLHESHIRKAINLLKNSK